MNIGVTCWKCILDPLPETVRRALPDEPGRSALFRHILAKLGALPEDAAPPDAAAEVQRCVAEVTGGRDFYREIKDRSTDLGLAMLPAMRELVEKASDPFETALRIAIGGNIIDYGCLPDFDLATAETRIREVLTLPLDPAAVARARRLMENARSILYLLDNCGEAVLDRLLVERFADKITLAVRGGAIYNDVNRCDLVRSQFPPLPVVDTGDCTPGVSLRHASAAFQKAMRAADLVVAKGQGNYETLDRYDRPILHLLRIKCPVVAARLGAPQGSLQVLARNAAER